MSEVLGSLDIACERPPAAVTNDAQRKELLAGIGTVRLQLENDLLRQAA